MRKRVNADQLQKLYFQRAMCINQGKEVICFVVWCYTLEVSIANSADPDQTVPYGAV